MSENDQILKNIESLLNSALTGLSIGENLVLSRSKEFYGETISDTDTDLIAEAIYSDLELTDTDKFFDNDEPSFGSEDPIQRKVYETITDILEPFQSEMMNFRNNGSKAEEKVFCTGMIMGLNRYEASGFNDFRELSQDALEFFARGIYAEWKVHNPGDNMNLYDEHLYNR